jgi:hypothetical protein
MAELEIETRRFFKKNSVRLLTNRLIVKKTSPFETSEFELSYEQIENKKEIETKVNFGLLVISSLAAIVGFLYLFGSKSEMTIVFFIISIVLLFIAFATKLKVVVIKAYNGQNIELYFANKNKDEVIIFAEKLIDSANNYLLSKYTKIDRDLPIDNQIQMLIVLRDKELLSEDKFEQLKNQLLGRENKTGIGYR